MNVFDVIGPVMIGPSSSHTAGAARLGLFAHNLLKSQPVKAEIIFYGSFAKTYRGHGTDKAIVAGIMGMQPDDMRLRDSLHIAAQEHLAITMSEQGGEGLHPNTVLVRLYNAEGAGISIQGESVGGGNVHITQINGLAVSLSGSYDTLVVVHQDTPGVIAAVTQYLGGLGVNICNIHLSREEKGGTAIMTIEADGQVEEALNEYVGALPYVFSSSLIPRL